MLNDTFGLLVSRSGWCQADQKLARITQDGYAKLVEAIQQSSLMDADAISWRSGTLAVSCIPKLTDGYTSHILPQASS